jgi:hypothetical protein
LSLQRGNLEKQEMFVKICGVVGEKVHREHSSNPNAKYGMRYDKDALAFFIAMRGHGHRSAEQYGLLRQVIGGVCERQIRYAWPDRTLVHLRPNPTTRNITRQSDLSMDGMHVSKHNIQRIAHVVEKKGYKGVPLVLAKDGTVVSRFFSCAWCSSSSS